MSDKRVGEDVPIGLAARGCPRRKAWLRNVAETLVAIGREIFDESGYARFLIRAGMCSSPEAYAAFRGECEAAQALRPKCC